MREAHCGGINGWIVGKKRIDLGFHVIIGRNDVQEILDDAKTEIGLALVDWNCNPRLSHSPLSKHLQSKSAIPYAGVMTTIISGNRNDGQSGTCPRLD